MTMKKSKPQLLEESELLAKQRSKIRLFADAMREMANKLPSEERRAHEISVKKMNDSFKRQMDELAGWEAEAEALFHNAGMDKTICEVEDHIKQNPPSAGAIALLIKIAGDKLRQQDGAKGGSAKAAKLEKPKKEICEKWATGNFKSRDICAEQEYSSLGFSSFKAARTALIGTPAPKSWPAKTK